jgi:hypothetical protein
MDEILKTLCEHTGISLETAKTALGAIMAFLKEHLPEGLSGDLMKSLPDAHGLASAYEANAPAAPGGGLIGAITGLATKFLGDNAGEATKLVGMLQGAGLDLKQIEAFLPKVIELIKAHIPAELYDKIIALIPGAAASETA